MSSKDTFVLDAVPLEDDLADTLFLGLDQGTYNCVEIGRGSQGSVSRIKAEDQGLDVAVKSILMSQMDSLSQLDRLEREAAVLQSLPDHPGVARYLGYRTREVPRTGSIDTEYSLLMEFVGGEPLSTMVGKPLDDSTLLDYCDQLYDTLGFLHGHNVVHRDIKPSNLMRQNNGRLKLIDFGLVKKVGQTTMTISKGAFLGSINYAAPEVEEGTSTTGTLPASDLYSLGVLLTVLKRRKEFSYRTRPEDIRAAVKEMHFEKPELKERLEAMLCDDPVKRMEKIKLVEEKYVYGGGNVVEIVAINRRESGRFSLKNVIGNTYKVLSSVVGAALFPYFIATTHRINTEIPPSDEGDVGENAKHLLTGMIGLFSLASTITGMFYPETSIYVIPTFAATNLGSLVYENLRERKLLEKSKEKLLEDKVDAASPTYVHPPPRNATDLYA